MADSISFKVDTRPFREFMDLRQANMAKAAQLNVRTGARMVTAAARNAAPVLGGRGVARIRAWKLSVATGNEPAAGPGSRPVAGLLRASIKPSKKLTFSGGAWSSKVGPRGERVHLYARKQEDRYHYMEAGFSTVASQMTVIAQASYDKVWKE